MFAPGTRRGLLGSLLAAIVALLVFPAFSSAATTRYVANCGPCMGVTYFTLTAAVNAAVSGDTIILQKSVTESPGTIDSKVLEIQGPGPAPVLNWTASSGYGLVNLMNSSHLTVRFLNLDCRDQSVLDWVNPQQPVSFIGCTFRQSVQVYNVPILSFRTLDAAVQIVLVDCEGVGSGAPAQSFIRVDGNMSTGPHVQMVNCVVRDFTGSGASVMELYPTTTHTNLFDIRQCSFGNVSVGIYATNNSSGAVTNTVFSGLTDDVQLGTGTRARFTNCAFDTTMGWNSTCITITGANEFVDMAGGDYHLKAGASCIDQGVDLVSVSNDKDGNARPMNTSWDIGAYEYLGGATPTSTPTAIPTVIETPSETPTPSSTPTDTSTATETHSPSPTATDSMSPTATLTTTDSVTPTESPKTTDTPTFSLTPTPSCTFTASSTPTSTWTETGTSTPTVTVTMTASSTETATSTVTRTPTSTWTETPTETPTDSPTFTPTSSFTASVTPSFTPTRSVTPSPTGTSTPTFSTTWTFTPTVIPTHSPTPHFTMTPASSWDFILDANRYDPAADPPMGIHFTWTGEGEANLAVYNVAGLRVRALLRTISRSGVHRLEWEGKDDRGVIVKPGLYLVVLTRSGRRDILKIVVRPR